MNDRFIDLSNAADMEVYETFSIEFNVEEKLASFEHWRLTDKLELDGLLTKVLRKLEAGGTRESDCKAGESIRDRRKRFTVKRNKIQHDIASQDPRVIQAGDVDEFLFNHRLADKTKSSADLSSRKGDFKRLLVQTVNDTTSFSLSGLLPFRLDAERSALTFRVKTLEDYTRDTINDHGARTTKTLTAKKRDIENNIELIEVYGSLPTDIKMMASLHLDHSLEFSIQVATLQDNMLKTTLSTYRDLLSTLPSVAEQAAIE